MYFYELHEGDNDQFSDLLLARETEMEPDVFFDIVQAIRRRVQDSYEQNSLVEAIADELEQDYEFIAITDDRLVAAVNVSKIEGDNFLAELDEDEDEDEEDGEDGDGDEDEDEEDGEGEPLTDAEFRSLYVDMDPSPDLRTN